MPIDAADERRSVAPPHYFGVRRYVAFLDILGFRELVRRIHDEEGLFDKIRTILEEIAGFKPTPANPSLPGSPDEIDFQTTHFSDSIVLSTWVTDPGLYLTSMMAALLSVRLLGLGVFTRGGIAVGSLRHDSSIIFGDALIEAYDLERRVAVYPRIVLSDIVAGALRASRITTPTCMDRDGVTYLHYLSPAFKDLLNMRQSAEDAPDGAPPLAFFNPVTAAGAIVAALGRERDLGIRAKLIWLARYYNDNATSHGFARIALEL